jgi:hypothetical protein
MGTCKRHIRPDEADEEARKAHATIWLGEKLLQHAHEVAQEAAERHRRVTGEALTRRRPVLRQQAQ